MASHYIGANSLETGRGYTAGGLNINIPTWGPAVSPGHPLICAIKLISILMPCKSLPWLICQKKKVISDKAMANESQRDAIINSDSAGWMQRQLRRKAPIATPNGDINTA